MLSSTDAALHLPDPVSIPSASVGGPGAALSHDLVHPVRQLLSSVASNHPGGRPLEEELSQLEASDENFHRYVSFERERERSALFVADAMLSYQIGGTIPYN